MTDLKPSESRIALAQGINDLQVVDHGWKRGRVTWTRDLQQKIVTGRIAEFRLAGLLEAPGADGEKPPYSVRLNSAGEAWLAEHGGTS